MPYLENAIQILAQEKDHSTNPTVVEYAIQGMFKRGGSPAIAAKRTAEKLNGFSNMIIDSENVVNIDPTKLEFAIWERLVDNVMKSLSRVLPGKEEYALLGAQKLFNQKGKNFIFTLKEKVEARLGKSLEELGSERVQKLK